MQTNLLFMQALSPLHSGTGESNGAVDLAIARDRATGFPYFPGSSLKGTLRARAVERAVDTQKVTAVFGPERENASDHAGALVAGDGNLLLLPARAMAGTFAYLTCPYLLHRFARDVHEAGFGAELQVPKSSDITRCGVSQESILCARVGNTQRVILEDLDFAVDKSDEVTALAKQLGTWIFPGAQLEPWRNSLSQRLCMVADDAMGFMSEQAMDVVARIALDPNNKTVQKGALWYEENLPTETVLVALLSASASLGKGKRLGANEVMATVAALLSEPLQLGGHATIGRGRCRLELVGTREGQPS